MKKLTRNALFMALSLSLAACGKDNPEEQKPSSQNGQSQQNPQDKGKDNNTHDSQSDAKSDSHSTNDSQSDAKSDAQSDDLSQKEPQIGDQCAEATFMKRCIGNAELQCVRQEVDQNSPHLIVKKDCSNNAPCTTLTYDGASLSWCQDSKDLYDSCSEAFNAYFAEPGLLEAYLTCREISAESLRDDFGIEDSENTYYAFDGRTSCVNAGNNKYLIWQSVTQICSSCSVDLPNKSATCEQNSFLTGENASENDACAYMSFVSRRINSQNALICDEDTKKVKKFTCPGNLEIAFTKHLEAILDIGSTGMAIDVVCVNTQEPECKADLFKCGTHEGKAASFLDKGCFTTDKGRHLASKENAPDWENAFTSPMVCGDKGCNQATGMCNK